MEKIFFVANDDLNEVNRALSSGGKVKMIEIAPQPITSYGYGGGRTEAFGEDVKCGNVFAYIVVEYPNG